jgi:hypothetical protein
MIVDNFTLLLQFLSAEATLTLVFLVLSLEKFQHWPRHHYFLQSIVIEKLIKVKRFSYACSKSAN